MLTAGEYIPELDYKSRDYKPFGGSFPSPGELREYATKAMHRGFPDDSAEILARGAKPPDWEPVSIEEVKRLIADRKPCEWPA